MENIIIKIHNYINSNLDETKNIEELKKLVSFLKEQKHEFSIEELKEIIKNDKMKKILENVCKNPEFIDDEVDDTIILLIDIYENKNNDEFEKEIYMRIKQGDKEAKKDIIIKNKGLVAKIALRYTGRGVDIEDLIQEGNLGLLEALEKYDVNKGFKFSTYAVFWIRCSIQRAVCKQAKCVRIPAKVGEQIAKYRVARELLTKKLSREPLLEEISEQMGISLKELERIVKANYDYLSIDAPLNEDSDTCLQEVLASEDDNPEEVYIKKELSILIKNLLDNCDLTENEKIVLIKRYGLDGDGQKTLQEVGDCLKISRERVRQIEFRALRKIKISEAKKTILDYTDNPEEQKKYIKR